ncbi:50S ribosomal protein L13 [Spiroplasma endosymbiont of Anurida maritima]|uniref:50S ribosomal protein L13 n=1 Tax=Spiroplasma endosymbiont of Anurida maritima TaxID=2967972 RepID=UPI0036D2491D
MRQTTMINATNVEKKWYIIDANDLILGRMATKIALILKGKTKPNYTPHVDCGDNVIVINAEKIAFSGNKLNKKNYYKHSLYIGGLTTTKAKDMLVKKPVYPVERAVRLMLPKNRLGSKLYRNLFVYAGEKHPHEAQQPIMMDVSDMKKGGN